MSLVYFLLAVVGLICVPLGEYVKVFVFCIILIETMCSTRRIIPGTSNLSDTIEVGWIGNSHSSLYNIHPT